MSLHIVQQGRATHTPTSPITMTKKYSCCQFVRTFQDDNPLITDITFTTCTTHNSNAYFLDITGNHAKLGRLHKATFRSKTQFKVLLDCNQSWQNYVSLHKCQKKLTSYLISGLIRAINKHEEFFSAEDVPVYALSQVDLTPEPV